MIYYDNGLLTNGTDSLSLNSSVFVDVFLIQMLNYVPNGLTAFRWFVEPHIEYPIIVSSNGKNIHLSIGCESTKVSRSYIRDTKLFFEGNLKNDELVSLEEYAMKKINRKFLTSCSLPSDIHLIVKKLEHGFGRIALRKKDQEKIED